MTTHTSHPSKPTVGRTVHFRTYAEGQHVPTHEAAIITSVIDAEEGLVSLCVLHTSGMEWVEKAKLDEEAVPAARSWCWPARS